MDSPIEIDVEEFVEIRRKIHQQMIEDLQNQKEACNMSGDEFLFYCHKLSTKYTTFNWGFAWDILEDQILQFIPQGKTYCPIRDESENATEYLGCLYSLQDISNQDEFQTSQAFKTIFGDPEDIIDIGDLETDNSEEF